MTKTISYILCASIPLACTAFTGTSLPQEHAGRQLVRPPSSTTSAHTSQRTRFSPLRRQPFAVVVHADALLSDDRRSASKKRKAWPRRVWSRIFSTTTDKQRVDRKTPALQMQTTMDEETEALLQSITAHYDTPEDFLLRSFEENTPRMVLPEVVTEIDAEFFDVATHANDSATREKAHDSAPTTRSDVNSISSPSAVSMARVGPSWFENSLTGILHRRSTEAPEDLEVQAMPRGNVVGSLVRGRFDTDAQIRFGRLVFPLIRMSSGTLEVRRLALNILAFLQTPEKRTVPRFPKQFDLHFSDWTFSRHDLLFSPCIRNGLRRLLKRILKDRGVLESSIEVTSLDILPTGKISCIGKALTLIGSPLHFEVRTGISFSSRGHVLTFPGLEVALNRDIGLFVPLMPEIDLDVGHNARFHSIEIDGRKKTLSLGASVTITPQQTIRLMDEYKQSSQAFAARFSVDVGKWLTRIGDFSK